MWWKELTEKYSEITNQTQNSFVFEFVSTTFLVFRNLTESSSESIFLDCTLLIVLRLVCTLNSCVKYHSSLESEVLQRLKVKWQLLVFMLTVVDSLAFDNKLF